MAKVDWLNATFPKPALSEAGFVSLLARMLGRPVTGIEGGGMLGFERTLKLHAHHGREKSAIGFLAMGGESQQGRWLLSLSGAGCKFVPDWCDVAQLLEDLGARITRVDLAVDFLEGENTVDDAVALYQVGAFTMGGRAPSSSLAGDWLNLTGGRTLYVGKSQNGKMLRVYEKGRQLGDPDSAWVRFEVQLGNRDRVIPLEALTDRDAYFAGCYPCLAEMIDKAAKAIVTAKVGGTVSAAHLVHHMRRCYGKVIDWLSSHTGVSNADLVVGVRVMGLPKRLDHSQSAAGVSWADVLALSKGKS